MNEKYKQKIAAKMVGVPDLALLDEYIRRQNWGAMVGHGRDGLTVEKCKPHGAALKFDVSIKCVS